MGEAAKTMQLLQLHTVYLRVQLGWGWWAAGDPKGGQGAGDGVGTQHFVPDPNPIHGHCGSSGLLKLVPPI